MSQVALAKVHVLNALSGSELLPETAFPCAELAKQVRAALGERPSRQVTLLHDGGLLSEDYQAPPGERLELTAVLADALTVEERDAFLRRLRAVRPFTVERIFARFPDAARDDAAVILAAVRCSEACLRAATETARDDRALVLAAVQQGCYALQHASTACQDDRQLVLAAVRRHWRNLEHASATCRDDREIVLAAVRQNGRALACAGESCKNDEEIVQIAVQQNAAALSRAGPRFRPAKRTVRVVEE